MSKKRRRPETPDESIPQDPGVPGPSTKQEADWPPESATATSSAAEGFVRDAKEAEDTSVSEAIGRMPRHRIRKERRSGR